MDLFLYKYPMMGLRLGVCARLGKATTISEKGNRQGGAQGMSSKQKFEEAERDRWVGVVIEVE